MKCSVLVLLLNRSEEWYINQYTVVYINTMSSSVFKFCSLIFLKNFDNVYKELHNTRKTYRNPNCNKNLKDNKNEKTSKGSDFVVVFSYLRPYI